MTHGSAIATMIGAALTCAASGGIAGAWHEPAAGAMTLLAAELPRLRPGQYERTIQTTASGRPPAAPSKMLQCITAEDVREFWKAMHSRALEPDCGVADYRQSAAEVRYTRTCIVSGARMTSKVTITFPTSETFHAVVETKRTGGQSADRSPMLQGSTIRMTARRVGDCSK
jgi:hypothetical protein